MMVFASYFYQLTFIEKDYKSIEHEVVRFNLFKENVELIEKHNEEYSIGLHTYSLGINRFSDWSFDEFKQKLLTTKFSKTKVKYDSTSTFIKLPSEVIVPDQFDWRDEGIITEVKDQGDCNLTLL
jgi:C1A family cysteine protease